MNLVVDIGNTQGKYAVFFNSEILKKGFFSLENEKSIVFDLFKETDIKKCIVSSVKNIDLSFIASLEKHVSVLVLDENVPLPFKNLYKTKNTLGVDRIALVASAALKYPNKNVLVIDAGTCITYDFINSDSEYLGGAISLGIDMRYKALHNFTDKLPLLNKVDVNMLIGGDTSSAIHSGVINGIVYEIDGIIDKYSIDNNNLTIVLTGGDSYFLSKRLKNGIFANSKFLMEGLNNILNYNNNND